MKDSVTYMEIFGDGKAVEARALVVKVGERRMGPMPAAIRAEIDRIAEVPRLEDLVVRAAVIASWDELLAAPSA